jgi:hypothetical protein
MYRIFPRLFQRRGLGKKKVKREQASKNKNENENENTNTSITIIKTNLSWKGKAFCCSAGACRNF